MRSLRAGEVVKGPDNAPYARCVILILLATRKGNSVTAKPLTKPPSARQNTALTRML